MKKIIILIIISGTVYGVLNLMGQKPKVDKEDTQENTSSFDTAKNTSDNVFSNLSRKFSSSPTPSPTTPPSPVPTTSPISMITSSPTIIPKKPIATRAITSAPPTVIPTVSEVKYSTGAKIEPAKPLPTQKFEDMMINFRSKMPYTSSKFVVNFDYKHNTIVVDLYQPTSANRIAFYVWLKDNGFDTIPSSYFIYNYL